ncbi:MAG: YbaK/EbsC family protein [Sporolactobacillus sp.]
MSIEAVKHYFSQFGRDKEIIEFNESTATVQEAAEQLGVRSGQIAKSLAFSGENKQGALLLVVSGDARIDNKKFKQQFGFKARMLSPDDTLNLIGHAVGGVCPFALNHDWPIYMDESLKQFDALYPACGSSHSAIKLSLNDLFEFGHGKAWVNVCKDEQ